MTIWCLQWGDCFFKWYLIIYFTLSTNLLRYKYGTIIPLEANKQTKSKGK